MPEFILTPASLFCLLKSLSPESLPPEICTYWDRGLIGNASVA